jgi:hypothetical protein
MNNDGRSTFVLQSYIENLKENIRASSTNFESINNNNNIISTSFKQTDHIQLSPSIKPKKISSTPKKRTVYKTDTSNESKNKHPGMCHITFNNSSINIQGETTNNNFIINNSLAKDVDLFKNPGKLFINKASDKDIDIPNISNYPVSKRYDRKGVNIVKGGNKHSVSFIDRVEPNRRLAEVLHIDSFKDHNLVNTYGEKGSSISCTNRLACCLII